MTLEAEHERDAQIGKALQTRDRARLAYDVERAGRRVAGEALALAVAKYESAVSSVPKRKVELELATARVCELLTYDDNVRVAEHPADIDDQNRFDQALAAAREALTHIGTGEMGDSQ